jgi:hypothetical protein
VEQFTIGQFTAKYCAARQLFPEEQFTTKFVVKKYHALNCLAANGLPAVHHRTIHRGTIQLRTIHRKVFRRKTIQRRFVHRQQFTVKINSTVEQFTAWLVHRKQFRQLFIVNYSLVLWWISLRWIGLMCIVLQ